jgi:Tfp pilus assembly protein PilE
MTTRRAFTLLEVMLAVLIGSMVVIAVSGLFSAMDRSQRRQDARMNESQDFATAQRTISRALRTLVMSNAAQPNEAELMEKIERASKSAADTQEALQVDDDAQTARLSLQHDIRQGRAVGNLRPQVLQVSLQAPPIALPHDARRADRDARGSLRPVRTADERQSMRERLRAREERRLGGANPGANLTPAEKDAAGTAAPGGPLPDELGEYTRSPGVRAVFELRPDEPDIARLRAARGQAEPGWSLWYRELPPRDDGDEFDTPRPGESELDRARRQRERSITDGRRGESRLDRARGRTGASDGTDDYLLEGAPEREVRLMSGLRTAKWTVFRREERGQKIAAVWASELPAYIEFEVEALSGRREKWMFEVGWRDGPEPGARITGGEETDPLAALIREAFQQINSGGAGGAPNQPDQPGQFVPPPGGGGK